MNWLVLSLLVFLSTCAPALACSNKEERSLHMINISNGKEIDIVYFRNCKYLHKSVVDISRFMGDRRAGKAVLIDTDLLDFLYDLHIVSRSNQPYRFISGYRTEESNRSVGGSENSWHLKGKAADIVLWDVPVKDLYMKARKLRRGGVGLYDTFIHLDVGKPRSWEKDK